MASSALPTLPPAFPLGPPAESAVSGAAVVPLPGPRPVPDAEASGSGGVARWYERVLGWAAVEGPPVQLPTGLRFDALDLPATAGFAVLRRVGGGWPVALCGDRMLMLVAAGSADELPGLLDWLEWGGVGLDLAARGTGGRMPAPTPPGWNGPGTPGAAVWLRPPEPGREVEPALPGLPPFARAVGGGDVTGLARLVSVAATECHRARLLGVGTPRAAGQRLASS
ncbi:SCO3374 family protein [Streptomyces coeruleoprunus]|uniref:SCO3374 family protein n=1 Tax=Streptomyces coeruleoprunus TaxID=285563 RepID=A0ABV9XD98_9ACTN